MMMYYMTYIHVESVKKSVYDELETVLSFEILFENTCTYMYQMCFVFGRFVAC